MAPEHPYLVDILNRRQQTQAYVLIGLWTVSVAIFAFWWFQPSHVANPWLFAFNSFVLEWAILMPAYYFYFLRRMKKPNPELPIPADWRVAMVVTRAPSEPLDDKSGATSYEVRTGEQFAFEQPIIKKIVEEQRTAGGVKGQVTVGELKRID
jgi:hypothetical protein